MYKVIIADDEVIERTVLGKKIKKNFGDSISLRQARNGREVVSFYKEESADILILDIEMPGVTGLEAAEQIRAMGAACGIIFLTAFDEFSYAKRAISVRALDYLLKPCDDRELIAAVEEGMRGADERHRRAAEAATRMAMQTGAAASAGEVQTGTGIAGGQGFVNRQVMVNGQIVAGQMSTGQDAAAAAQATAMNREMPDRQMSPDISVAGLSSAAAGLPAAGSAQSKENENGADPGAACGVGGQQERIRQIIRRDYMNELSVSDIADELGYSEAYFCKLFKQYFGQSFISFLTDYRIREAKRLLTGTNISVKEAGQAVGYADANYFAKVFKRVTGQSPTDCRLGNMH